MSRFCGFPTGVRALPIVTPIASVISSTLGRILICLASPSMIGVATSARVSLTRNAERVLIPKSTMANALCGDFARPSIRIVTYSSSPEMSIAATSENIPRRKKMTSRFTAWYASWSEIGPRSSTLTAPVIIIVQTGIRSHRRFLRIMSE